MRHVLFAAALIGAAALAEPASAQRFTPQELDRMSQERSDTLSPRDPGPRPAPGTQPREVVRPLPGLWVCHSTDEYLPILAAPSANSRQIGISSGRIAAGANRGDYTTVLISEGKVGYVPKSAVRPYRNEFNPRATCTVAGLKPSGIVQFDVR